MNRLWLIIFALVFAWSAIRPFDIFTWFLEVSPAIIALLVLLATRKTLPPDRPGLRPDPGALRHSHGGRALYLCRSAAV